MLHSKPAAMSSSSKTLRLVSSVVHRVHSLSTRFLRLTVMNSYPVSVLIDAAAFDGDDVKSISTDQRLLAAWRVMRNVLPDPMAVFDAATIAPSSSSSYVVTFQVQDADR